MIETLLQLLSIQLPPNVLTFVLLAADMGMCTRIFNLTKKANIFLLAHRNLTLILLLNIAVTDLLILSLKGSFLNAEKQ